MTSQIYDPEQIHAAVEQVQRVAAEQLAHCLEPGAMQHVLVHAWLGGVPLSTSRDVDYFLDRHTGLSGMIRALQR